MTQSTAVATALGEVGLLDDDLVGAAPLWGVGGVGSGVLGFLSRARVGWRGFRRSFLAGFAAKMSGQRRPLGPKPRRRQDGFRLKVLVRGPPFARETPPPTGRF